MTLEASLVGKFCVKIYRLCTSLVSTMLQLVVCDMHYPYDIMRDTLDFQKLLGVLFTN